MKEEKKLLKGLKTKYFHFIMMKSMKNKWKLKKKQKKKEQEEEKKEKRKKKNKKSKKNKKQKSEEKKFTKYIENKSKGISYDLFKKYFDFETPIQLTKNLLEIKDKKKNSDFLEEIRKI